MQRVTWQDLDLVVAPGAYAPRSDTDLLLGALRELDLPPGARVLDLCTGTGAVALAAARDGAQAIAVDVTRRAALAARINARRNGLAVDVRRGDLWAAVRGERFDVITSNPPYLPEVDGATLRSGCWDAGADGRAVLDRLCEHAHAHLRPGGTVLLVQSHLAGEAETVSALVAAGLRAEVVAVHEGPYGPIAAERVDDPGGVERMVVVRGRAPSHRTSVQPEAVGARLAPARAVH